MSWLCVPLFSPDLSGLTKILWSQVSIHSPTDEMSLRLYDLTFIVTFILLYIYQHKVS